MNIRWARIAAAIIAAGPIIGLDIACACDFADGQQHHPALAVLILAGLNFAAGFGWARDITARASTPSTESPSHAD